MEISVRRLIEAYLAPIDKKNRNFYPLISDWKIQLKH